jgi:hypothetical protein
MSKQPVDNEGGQPTATLSRPEAPPAVEKDNEALLETYKLIADSYHKIDDFRAKLLALLPLASGAGIFFLLRSDLGLRSEGNSRDLIAVGLLGFLATLGLFVYEIRGIQRCWDLIEAGRRLERELGLPKVKGRNRKYRLGAFDAPRPIGFGRLLGPFGAALLIYPAVLGAWAYLIGVGLRWW